MITKEKVEELIQNGRTFMKTFNLEEADNYETDQYLHLPQPPLTKEPMTQAPYIDLPMDFEQLSLKQDLYAILQERQSHRIYDRQSSMSLLQLSWLLWASQGVKGIRGKSYATLRTVASGGARHPFEVYLFVQRVESLEDGLYHYLPMQNQLELLQDRASLEQQENKTMQQLMSEAVCEQAWAGYANVLFVYSMVAYRAEWRYGIYAHRPALMDAGHVTENLYLACTAANMGTCAIAAIDGTKCDALFRLDGKEEFCFYAATGGLLKAEDQAKEDDLYAFVKEQGL